MLRHRTQSSSMPGYASAPVIRTAAPDVNIFFAAHYNHDGDSNPYRPTTLAVPDRQQSVASTVFEAARGWRDWLSDWRRRAADHVPWTFVAITAVQIAIYLADSPLARGQLSLAVDRSHHNGTWDDA